MRFSKSSTREDSELWNAERYPGPPSTLFTAEQTHVGTFDIDEEQVSSLTTEGVPSTQSRTIFFPRSLLISMQSGHQRRKVERKHQSQVKQRFVALEKEWDRIEKRYRRAQPDKAIQEHEVQCEMFIKGFIDSGWTKTEGSSCNRSHSPPAKVCTSLQLKTW